MAQIIIKAGEPQPLDCEHCEDKFGYQVSDYLKTHYHTQYEESGKHCGAFYSDYQPLIHKGTSAYCINCASKLKFRIAKS